MKEKEIIKNVIENKRVVTGPDYRDMGAILLFIFLLPYIVSFFFGNTGIDENASGEGEIQKQEMMAEEMFQDDFEEAEYIVCNTTVAGTEMIPLETYLVSRLPATIDMEYETEVLKAQAVVLRTQLLRMYYEDTKENETAENSEGNVGENKATGDKAKDAEGQQTEHPGKDEIQGKRYIYVESDLPQVSAQVYEKSKAAVESTRGMYMVYEGTAIMAPYFAVSAGRTREGKEAFYGEDYPYLKSVECERDFTAKNYVQTVKLSKQLFYQRLWELGGEKGGEEEIQKQQEELCARKLTETVGVQRDSAGYVTDVSFEGTYISGEGVRAAFLLNSSCFEWEEEQNTVIIRVKGVGHGLGLCHYGANEAAKKGSDYIDILKYFFADIVIEKSE